MFLVLLTDAICVSVLSNNAVRANELPGHLHVPAGLVNEGQVKGDLPLQIHLIVWHALQEDESRTETEGRTERRRKGFWLFMHSIGTKPPFSND